MAGIGSTPSLIIGAAVGGAASAAFAPALEIPRQEAWASNPVRILDAELLARLVAQGGVDLADAQAEAVRDGYDANKLDALVYLAQTVPGVGEAMQLWRRGLLSDDQFTHSLVKAGLVYDYVDPIVKNKLAEIIGLGDIGYAVVRGMLPAPSWVPVAPPASGDKVPRFPQVQLDPVELAAKLGYDEDMLQLIVGRSGLSMAPGMAAQAEFRGIIGPDDFLLAVAEGDLRTEWGEALHEVSRAIPSPGEFVEARLRGWIDEQEMQAGAGRHGMRDVDTQLLYEIKRRPMPVRAITTGLARGGQFNPASNELQDPYEASVHQANLGPEWYDLAIANKYSYPSAFVIRALLEAGVWTQERAEEVLLQIGWPPDIAKEVSTFYAPSGSSGGDKHVAKAQTQLWNTTHTSYKQHEISDATATDALTTAGVSTEAIPNVLSVWQAERDLIRKSLSASQLKKAYTSQADNPATSQPWTQTDALLRLAELGYDQQDAQTLLEL